MQRKLIAPFALLFLFAAGLASQVAGGRANITGAVMDQAGAVVAQVPVELRQLPTGPVRNAATDKAGKYTFNGLPAGTFDLSVTAAGFKKYSRQVTLAEGQTLRTDIALERGTQTEPKTVTENRQFDRAEMPQPAPPPPPPAARPQAQGAASGAPSGGGGKGKGGAKGGSGGVAGGVPMGGPAPMYRTQDTDQRYDRYGRYSPGIPGTEQYGHYIENEFTSPQQEPLSTFAADVDTASYSNIRRFLTDGQLPPQDSVRIEELINYFRYDYPLPKAGEPVSVTTHLMRSPWNPQRQLLHVGLRTTPIAAEDLPPSHLTFLIDVSGSMAPPERLPLVQQSLQMLARQLRPQDTVAIAVYAGAAGTVLPPTRGDRRQEILDAIGRLQAGGSTNGAGGIRLAYQLARQSFSAKANNRVILATDGDFNVGVTSDDELVRLIESERKSGVFLSILGVGSGNLKDAKMEKLADYGNGNYSYLDSLSEARKVLVQEMGATLVTVAKDVKLQIEFNPSRVKEYRLVGYENRLLRPEDFNNDAKDAGDLGAGHQVTAFYEIIPAGSSDTGGEVDPLRYQTQAQRTAPQVNRGNELAWLKLRHKAPQGDRSELLQWPVSARAEDFRSAPQDVRFAAAVAEYGMLLRHSKFAGQASFEHVLATANESMGRDLDGYKADFVDLVRRAATLSGRRISAR